MTPAYEQAPITGITVTSPIVIPSLHVLGFARSYPK